MATIPNKLKILSHVYAVQVVDVPKGIESSNSALCDKGEGVLTIDNGLMETEKIVSLFHEIIHAFNGEISEEQVEFLAQCITQVLLDNDMLK